MHVVAVRALDTTQTIDELMIEETVHGAMP
jgi:hypothetical protein